ncbi:GCN5 family N-acetyltransferase [Jeotgalibacillus alimentarius]|uniref:GCN5 family N-acetyltransferase n=1 Tax=Jeotgalibacillus alimentarius TaxID=135826 RepID=A0A0C2WBW3_9BACL|nr:GNAT family N-acetyltransferase [Jeotgalibacillus alimentarius]KIL53518.1 GCN5 family N-acetyltransferase [Jeotgalibacillus alimentarius]
MKNALIITEVTVTETYINQLSSLLVEVVKKGASIGFIPPFGDRDANQYWQQVAGSDTVLMIAEIDQTIVGTVQLDLCTKSNGLHRAELVKLMVHPDYQGKGIGRELMIKAEEAAVERNRSLIVLDTRKGDLSNRLYLSMGYTCAGEIPSYAMSAEGSLDPTVFYYKLLKPS